jgi:hypothetical protein
MAKNGVFTDLSDVTLPFVATANQAYVVEFTVSDGSNGSVNLSAKAWTAGSAPPAAWQATATDSASDRLTFGSAGVRVSLYAGPVTVTVDDFAVTK